MELAGGVMVEMVGLELGIEEDGTTVEEVVVEVMDVTGVVVVVDVLLLFWLLFFVTDVVDEVDDGFERDAPSKRARRAVRESDGAPRDGVDAAVSSDLASEATERGGGAAGVSAAGATSAWRLRMRSLTEDMAVRA